MCYHSQYGFKVLRQTERKEQTQLLERLAVNRWGPLACVCLSGRIHCHLLVAVLLQTSELFSTAVLQSWLPKLRQVLNSSNNWHFVPLEYALMFLSRRLVVVFYKASDLLQSVKWTRSDQKVVYCLFCPSSRGGYKAVYCPHCCKCCILVPSHFCSLVHSITLILIVAIRVLSVPHFTTVRRWRSE